MFRLVLTLGLFFVVGFESVSAQTIGNIGNIRNFNVAANDRFTNDTSFIGAGFDFSGVARNADGKWGTLISPNAMLTAQHFRPTVGSTYLFYPDNDPNSTPVEAIVTERLRVGSTDLSIIILDRNVDPSIAIYDFATEEFSGEEPVDDETFFNTDPSEVDIVGDRVLVFGRSSLRPFDSPTNQAVGENLVFGYSENVMFGSNLDNDSIILLNDMSGSDDALTYETHVRGGDSGSPNFLIDSATNNLILIGVNSFRFDADPPSTFESSGVTYTGNQVEEINTILSDNVFVPPLLGDCNLDEVVDFSDISTFLSILSAGGYLLEADINQDESVDFFDIGLFISILE